MSLPLDLQVCNGLVLASDGKKMSKRLKNYPVRLSLIHSAVLQDLACVCDHLAGTSSGVCFDVRLL